MGRKGKEPRKYSRVERRSLPLEELHRIVTVKNSPPNSLQSADGLYHYFPMLNRALHPIATPDVQATGCGAAEYP